MLTTGGLRQTISVSAEPQFKIAIVIFILYTLHVSSHHAFVVCGRVRVFVRAFDLGTLL